jgi:hypothetical protein
MFGRGGAAVTGRLAANATAINKINQVLLKQFFMRKNNRQTFQ